MIRQAYRYKFAESVDLDEAEDTILLAIVAAEGLVGEARIRLDAAYTLERALG